MITGESQVGESTSWILLEAEEQLPSTASRMLDLYEAALEGLVVRIIWYAGLLYYSSSKTAIVAGSHH